MARPGATDPTGWSMLPLAVVRSTGFAVELLDAVRTPETARAADRLTELTRSVASARRRFLEVTFPAAVAAERAADAPRASFKQWYAVRRRVERGAPVADAVPPAAAGFVSAWNAHLDEARAAHEELSCTGAREGDAARARLHAVAADDRFAEAVFLSSPSMYRALRRYLSGGGAGGGAGRHRRTGVQLYGYLQRFTTKNETTSFFGPVDHAEVRTDQGEPVKIDPGEGRLRRRLTRVAFWAVQAIADAVAADEAVRPHLTPRVADGVRVDAAGAFDSVTGRRVVPAGADLQVLARCDGRVRAGELPAAALAGLARRGLVDLRLRPPSTVDDPLAWTRGWLAALPDDCAARQRWLAVVDRLAALATGYSDAPVDGKARLLHEAEGVFVDATGRVPARSGALYADRSLLYDEALGDLTIHLGPTMVDDLRDRLGPALDLCASFSTVAQEVMRERGREVALSLGDGRPVPYLAFVRALLAGPDPASYLTDARVSGFVAALTTLARQSQVCAGEVRLDPARLRPLLVPVTPGTPVSPDLFLSATSAEALAAGDFDVVIGEIHHGVQIWTHLLAFWPDQAGVRAALAAALSGDAATVHQRRQGKAFPRELPGIAVEFGGRSTLPRDAVMRAADLDVVPTDDGVALRGGARELRLHPGDPRAVANWVFGPPPVLAPPIEFGPHTPRIRVGGVVLQRETWHLAGAAFGPARAAGSAPLALARMRGLGQEVGLPVRWFAKVDGERKPFYVDLDSMASVEHLLSKVDGRRAVRCTEVLPALEHWWLPALGGGHRSAEWRTTWVYGSRR
jgi:hypothetical protein